MTARTAVRTCVVVNAAAATLPAITLLTLGEGGEDAAAIVALGIIGLGLFNLLTMAVALWLRGEKKPAFICGVLSLSPPIVVWLLSPLVLLLLEQVFSTSIGGRP